MPQAPVASAPAPPASPLTGHGHAAVVGLQWGDEGKGQIVDLLTADHDVIVRFNGGNNAGHSVHIGDEKFALHLLPSGITYPGKLSVIGNGVVVDPSPDTGLLKEIDTLAARGVTVDATNLIVSGRAHAVLPYHKAEDKLYDSAVAAAWDHDPIGTTGRGIGPCYADKALRSSAIRMVDLLDAESLHGKLKRNVTIKNAVLRALAEVCDADFEPFDADDLFEQVAAWGARLAPMIGDTRRTLWDAESAGRAILFEGANAALLDVDHGTYPFVTSSTTSVLGAATGSGLAPRKLHTVIGVAKAYTSRVGGGPHPTELDDATGEHIRQAGREFGTTTGRPRRVGWLDLTAVRYTAQLNGVNALVLTGLSVLAGLDTLRVCVDYELDGKRLGDFPPDAATLAQATPIYEDLPGFSEPTGGVRAYQGLPDQARAYVERVEAFVGVPVRIVCVGPRRDQVIRRG